MSLTKSNPAFEQNFQRERWLEECRLADREAQFLLGIVPKKDELQRTKPADKQATKPKKDE